MLILQKIQVAFVTALHGRSVPWASFRCNQAVNLYAIGWVLLNIMLCYKSGNTVRLTL